jgi:glycosyltransferase involved in cell wall biosynthesis
MVMPETHRYGEELSTLSLTKGLRDRGHLVDLVTAKGEFAREFEHVGARVFFEPVNARDPIGIARAARAVRRLLLDPGYDLIHSQEVVTTVIANIATRVPGRLRIPVIYHYRGIRPKFLPTATRILPMFANRIIANADFAMNEFRRRGTPAERVRTIYNGYAWESFEQARRRSEVRSELGAGSEEPILAAVGRLVPIKGHEVLLRALPAVLAKLPNARLLIVGEGPLQSMLQALCAELGLADRVRFLGFVPDVPRLLSGVDLLVLPSLVEPFGRVLVEAQAMRVPVVSTRVGGTSEIIVDGVTGRLVAPGDSEALARRIVEAFDDPVQSRVMAEAGYERARRLFSLEGMIGSVEDLYGDALAEAGWKGSQTKRPPTPGEGRRA